jgi:hypothetical protein
VCDDEYVVGFRAGVYSAALIALRTGMRDSGCESRIPHPESR